MYLTIFVCYAVVAFLLTSAKLVAKKRITGMESFSWRKQYNAMMSIVQAVDPLMYWILKTLEIVQMIGAIIVLASMLWLVGIQFL